ncbi:MAG: YgjV family protein [Clostridia bacterium]|nr:YgjV family protein [Clostridia bacterium]
MKIAATVFGILAVAAFGLSFQCRRRKDILLVNILSRVFYILQYLLLGALEGAVFDLIGAAAALPAKKKDSSFVMAHRKGILAAIFALLLLSGVLLYRSPWSLVPLAGVAFEIAGLWMDRERAIRLVSLAAQPFWLAYNIHSGAYGSVAGNVFAAVSILVALMRYAKQENNKST